MRIHCDVCGKAIGGTAALRREVDGEQLYYCGAVCLAKGGHVADEPWSDDEGAGPAIGGDLDDPPGAPRDA